MINLDQVRTLEWKVKQAVQLIVHLRKENDTLRTRLSDTEVRLQELEALVESVQSSQAELESGIRSAIEELDNIEGQAPAEAKPAFASDEPAALFDKGSVPADSPAETETATEPSFEEQFAALAAEEEAEKATSEALEDAKEPENEPEPTKSEQPGLGIF